MSSSGSLVVSFAHVDAPKVELANATAPARRFYMFFDVLAPVRLTAMTADPYGDPDLVAVYDLDNPDGIDHDLSNRPQPRTALPATQTAATNSS